MATQIIYSSSKKRPLLYSPKRGGLGEVSGKAVADFTAVCCCFPLGLANVVFFVVYKVPAGLCRMALKNNRHRRLQIQRVEEANMSDHDIDHHSSDYSDSSEEAVLKLEKEMFDRFYGAGFWRSPSQKSEYCA